MNNQPLKGFRILDVTNVLSGPFCGYQLGLLGAEIIKVEAPDGDLARQLGANPSWNEQRMGISFLAQNAGKRSISLNLKSEAGQQIFLELVKTSDALIENFRPGVMDRLGLGFEVCKATKDPIVYCAISGFGQQGPLKDNPAYDQIIQGMSGVMDITGSDNTPPYRVGYPIADTVGGLTAALAVSVFVQPLTFLLQKLKHVCLGGHTTPQCLVVITLFNLLKLHLIVWSEMLYVYKLVVEKRGRIAANDVSKDSSALRRFHALDVSFFDVVVKLFEISFTHCTTAVIPKTIKRRNLSAHNVIQFISFFFHFIVGL